MDEVMRAGPWDEIKALPNKGRAPKLALCHVKAQPEGSRLQARKRALA